MKGSSDLRFKGKIDLACLLEHIGVEYEFVGKNKPDRFDEIRPVSEIEPGCLTFINKGSPHLLELLKETSGACVIIERNWARSHPLDFEKLNHSLFLVDFPRLVIAQIVNELKIEKRMTFCGIHPTSIVNSEAIIHPSAAIGPFCIIGNSTIGEGVEIGPYVMIHHNVTIEQNVRIREHCTIGGSGLGYARSDAGSLVRIPHIGSVTIEEAVDIYPFVNVDCGTLSETRIHRGAKIDHYVHVGHNSDVGEDSIVTAGAVFCGGSSCGKRAWIGTGAIIKEKIHIGSDATIGLGAVVIKDVEEKAVVAGVPAKQISERRQNDETK